MPSLTELPGYIEEPSLGKPSDLSLEEKKKEKSRAKLARPYALGTASGPHGGEMTDTMISCHGLDTRAREGRMRQGNESSKRKNDCGFLPCSVPSPVP